MVHSGAGSGLGREIVLGLLVEGPANCYQLDVQLRERFSAFDYAAGTARHAVKGLSGEGLVRVAGSRRVDAALGVRGATLYEATSAGLDHFERWIRASVPLPPVREELDARIALCRPKDLPRMIEIVREAEALCLSKVQALNFRLRASREARDEMKWQQRMELVVTSGDHAWWESRTRWLQKVRVYLESELRDETGSPLLAGRP